MGDLRASLAVLPQPTQGAVMARMHSSWCWFVTTESTSMKACLRAWLCCWDWVGVQRKVGTG